MGHISHMAIVHHTVPSTMYVPTYVLVQFFSVFIYIKHYTLSTFCIEQVPLEPIEERRTRILHAGVQASSRILLSVYCR